VVHSVSSNFFGSQVATHSLGIDEILEKDPHDLGVFTDELLFYEKFPDGWDSDVVSVVDSVDLYPLDELLQSNLHLVFLNDLLYELGAILDLILQTSEEHPQDV